MNKKIMFLTVLVVLVGCGKGPEDNKRYCNKTFLGFFGYFDECFTRQYEWKKGNFYTGDWKNNKFHSNIGITSTESVSESGQWIQGEKHGPHYFSSDLVSFIRVYKMGDVIQVAALPGKSSPPSTPPYIPNIPFDNASAPLNLGSSTLNKKSSSSIKDNKAPLRKASYITTVDSNELCPLLSSPLIKQEVSRGQRFCYYQ